MAKREPLETLIVRIDEMEKTCADIFEENRELLANLGILYDETKTPRDFHHALNQRLKEIEAEGAKFNREEIRQINRILLACRIKEWLDIAGESLKNLQDETLSRQEQERLLAAYMAGVYRGILLVIDNAIEGMDFSFLKDILHSIKSREWQDGRWKPRDLALQEAMELAVKKWQEGDEAFHHEMAEYLLNRISGLSDHISVKVLQRELKPIAKKYDRLFGVKAML